MTVSMINVVLLAIFLLFSLGANAAEEQLRRTPSVQITKEQQQQLEHIKHRMLRSAMVDQHEDEDAALEDEIPLTRNLQDNGADLGCITVREPDGTVREVTPCLQRPDPWQPDNNNNNRAPGGGGAKKGGKKGKKGKGKKGRRAYQPVLYPAP